MHTTSIARGAIYAALVTSFTILTAFRSEGNHIGFPNGGDQQTYLHKMVSPAGQTTVEYNPDKSIRRIIQLRKTENATYSDVQLPVYENGRLVKCLSAADEKAVTGDPYLSFEYSSDKVSRISYYRDNAVYSYDSLAYDASGKIARRYQFGHNGAKAAWENSGYLEYTWNQEGDVERMDTYGKQPGYSKFVYTSSVSYTYDRMRNPQQLQPELAILLDGGGGSLSAHNVLTENISSPNTSRVITNTYTYAYNGKYPVRATFSSGMDETTVKLEWIKLQ
ncbi:hypothetical protein AB6805_20625 [Chitinophaga sp. RCC_12]|uniref:hypothetical protein n=1 Tax=Chitinophaga sp. RCC_12 TaxID=3239226 RepID=UPI0035244620